PARPVVATVLTGAFCRGCVSRKVAPRFPLSRLHSYEEQPTLSGRTLKREPRTPLEDSEPATAIGEPQLTRRSKDMRTLTRCLTLSIVALPLPAFAQAAPAA